MRTLKYPSLTILGAVLLGCASPRVPQPNGLSGQLSSNQPHVSRLADMGVSASIANHGPTNCTVNMWATENEILALEVLDPKGQVLPPVPPALPPPDVKRYERVLKPGESLKFTYTLDEYMVETPPGMYRVRLRRIPSNELPFRIE